MTATIELPTPAEADGLICRLQDTSPSFKVLMGRYGTAAPALRHFGLVEWQDQHLDDAIEAFRAALLLAPDDPNLWRDLAGAFEASLDAVRADRCIRQAIRLDPAAARSWLLLANLCSQRGEHAEAETAFGRAIAQDPALADAHFGLGLVQFAQRRLDEAKLSLRSAIRHGYANALGFTGLAHVLYLAGDYAECAAAFERALAFGPLEAGAHRKYLRARMFGKMIDRRVDEAIADYGTLAQPGSESLDDILRSGFAVLCAFGHRDAAIALGRKRLELDPDDPSQRYLLEAVSGEALSRAPNDYLESHFDAFADEFDRQLVDVLRYDAPEAMAALVARHRTRFSRGLDLGCGTGLAAEPLARFGGALTGVDLAGRMLEKAAERGLYADLVKAEAVAFLDACAAPFDLVFAADLLVYIGDLEPIFAGLARSMATGGILALSIETTAEHDYALLSSGRFAHDPCYVRRLAAEAFDDLEEVPAVIRLEANRPVEGMFFVLERRDGPSTAAAT
ncbi:MAG TPA: tetratricopeptide repeat protein [Lichenihabitans sp.]|nr:tetratricopeptide repeat protein [Lichenihabitans sp.]